MDVEVEGKKIRSELEQFSLPIIKLLPKAENAENIWSSKFGGKPYWPTNMEYPESKSGEKLILLAQLNFEELPNLAEFPQVGILQFFIEDDDVSRRAFVLRLGSNRGFINGRRSRRILLLPACGFSALFRSQ
ncbi:DUF1963 domain-containing protein [Vreelandella alkaliphila]|uniref:DUF1963 domain-containing protein n=1 Tax=Halomonas campaniensis TaxID=213554 RepID=A0A3D0KJF2_9GAMM|nr:MULTISPECIES: YwqG family protein [unclassified Halomonas]HBS83154.1 hypothetical protein [Halomonas campaniensis]HCA03702.1 hypothetical protein [Halomonas campaniensis]